MHRRCFSLLAAAAVLCAADRPFTFVILGDRTGEAQPGVYEQAWRDAAAQKPAFVLTTGDSIEGLNDTSAPRQWEEVRQIWDRRIPLYLAAGNHDIWSAASEQLFRRYAGRPPRYSFDHGTAHFTVLDNSRSDALSTEELDFLESDLRAHAAAPLKVIVSHRPSWLVDVGFRNADFRLHRLAKQYGVQYVVAGHIHQMLRFELEGITYLSMPSSGGHLRVTKAYVDGWFFAYARVDVDGARASVQVRELGPPHGQGRNTPLEDWGVAGLAKR
jgi:predicted phosphodiesterase